MSSRTREAIACSRRSRPTRSATSSRAPGAISSASSVAPSERSRRGRPFTGGRIGRQVRLQLEVPGSDEVMWARGDVVFDQLVPAKDSGPFGLLRRTGYHIAIAAARDLRLLRDYVYEMHRAHRVANDEILMLASCYGRG